MSLGIRILSHAQVWRELCHIPALVRVATDLFEEESGCIAALPTRGSSPLDIHWPAADSAFSTNNQPIDAGKMSLAGW